MKHLFVNISILLLIIVSMGLILGGVVSAEGLSSLGTQNDSHLLITNLLKEADQQKFRIDPYSDSDQILGQHYGTNIAAVIGEYSTMEGIMSVLGKYYSEDAAKIEVSKIGLYVVKNRIGRILASGEEAFLIDGRSKFEFIRDDEGKKLIKIVMVGDTAGTKEVFYYTLKLIQARWIIVDEAKEENMCSQGDDWVAVRASSTLYTKNTSYGTYAARNAWDKDPKTAWIEGKNDDGVGEWIDFSFYQSRVIQGIQIINGYAKSEGLYQANNRVKRVHLSFDDGTSFEAELNDGQIQPQLIKFPTPKKTERVRLTILEVYPGTKYRDTCISEIEFQ